VLRQFVGEEKGGRFHKGGGVQGRGRGATIGKKRKGESPFFVGRGRKRFFGEGGGKPAQKARGKKCQKKTANRGGGGRKEPSVPWEKGEKSRD